MKIKYIFTPVSDSDVEEEITENKTCCLCGGKIEGHGHNASPVKDGECCGKCNREKVIPARIDAMRKGDTEEETVEDANAIPRNYPVKELNQRQKGLRKKMFSEYAEQMEKELEEEGYTPGKEKEWDNKMYNHLRELNVIRDRITAEPKVFKRVEEFEELNPDDFDEPMEVELEPDDKYAENIESEFEMEGYRPGNEKQWDIEMLNKLRELGITDKKPNDKDKK